MWMQYTCHTCYSIFPCMAPSLCTSGCEPFFHTKPSGYQGLYSFVACLSHLSIIDHASLSRRSTVPTPNRRDIFNIWALISFSFSCRNACFAVRKTCTLDSVRPIIAATFVTGGALLNHCTIGTEERSHPQQCICIRCCIAYYYLEAH